MKVLAATEALALIGPPAREAVPLLLPIAAHDEPTYCSGLKALAAIEPASPRTVDAFLTFLENGDPWGCLNWSSDDLVKKIKPVPCEMIDRLRRLRASPEERRRRSAAHILALLRANATH